MLTRFLGASVAFKFFQKNSIYTSCRLLEELAEISPSETPIDPSKDRRNPVPVETSIRYMESKAYRETYKDNLIWTLYRRNFKGQFAPPTRKTCIRNGIVSTGNPCPICRDEYLTVDYRNVKLLEQFISPHNGEILSSIKTGVCKKKHEQLLVAILKARNYGYLTFDVPFRSYDYSLYMK